MITKVIKQLYICQHYLLAEFVKCCTESDDSIEDNILCAQNVL